MGHAMVAPVGFDAGSVHREQRRSCSISCLFPAFPCPPHAGERSHGSPARGGREEAPLILIKCINLWPRGAAMFNQGSVTVPCSGYKFSAR